VKYAANGAPLGTETTTPAAHTITRVGARIRARRKAEGLTLNDVAASTGVSVSMLSMLERGLAGASIGTLVAVASALHMQMYDLFEEPQYDGPEPVTRRDEQPQIETAEGVLRRLAHHSHEDGLEMAINEYEPHTASSEQATHHEGREFGIVLSGSLLIELDGVEHALRPGDAITYDSSVPHRIVNPGRSRARAVWVNLDK